MCIAAPRSFSIGCAGRWLFVIALAATIAPFGSVEWPFLLIALALQSLALCCGVASKWQNAELARVFAITLGILLLMSGYVVGQATSFEGNPFSHSAWELARTDLGENAGAISASPAATFAALPALGLPFITFLSALALHQNDDAALKLLSRLTVLGVLVALLGLAQNIAGRDFLLSADVAQEASLTAVFVNRNSAATFFGLAALAALGVGIERLNRIDGRSLVRRFLEPRLTFESRYNQFLAASVALVLIVLALALTQSRAGIASGAVAISTAVAWWVWQRRGGGLSARLLPSLLVAAASALAFWTLSARAIWRAQRQGSADARWCTYEATIAAIRDHVWFGTGLGTFDVVFPIYRKQECGIAGTWQRAHNSFLEGFLGLGFPFALLAIVCLVLLLGVFVQGLRERRRMRLFLSACTLCSISPYRYPA
jgi:O-antigen ligase